MVLKLQTLIQNRYQVKQLLKQEPGLTTCLAFDQQTQQPVILKELRLQTMTSWKSLELFQREAKQLQQLKHDQIPSCLAAFEVETPQTNNYYLVTAQAPGQSLQEKLDSGWSADENQASQIASQILEVLTYLHSMSPPVIHRDLKPANLMIDDNQKVYIIDFGAIQTVLNPLGGTTIVGTFGFMPPEQYLGQAVPASDLYALGATLLQLMTGTEPGGLNYEGLRLNLKKLLPHCSPAWQQWLAQMLEPELEERFASAETALQALDSLHDNHSVASDRIQIRRRGHALMIDVAPVGAWHRTTLGETVTLLLLFAGGGLLVWWGFKLLGFTSLFFTWIPVGLIFFLAFLTLSRSNWLENAFFNCHLVLRPQKYQWQRSWKKWQRLEQGDTRHLSEVEVDASFWSKTKKLFLNVGVGHRIPFCQTTDSAEAQKIQKAVTEYLDDAQRKKIQS